KQLSNADGFSELQEYKRGAVEQQLQDVNQTVNAKIREERDVSFLQKEKQGQLAFNGAVNLAESAKDAAPGSLSAAPPPASAAAQAQDTRKLIRNAVLEFEVRSFDAAVETIRAITNEDEGYVATADSARGANGKLRGTVVVKILPANLDKFLLQLRALGELKNQKLGTEDVTKAYFDTDARLRNSKRMEERLLDMLQ